MHTKPMVAGVSALLVLVAYAVSACSSGGSGGSGGAESPEQTTASTEASTPAPTPPTTAATPPSDVYAVIQKLGVPRRGALGPGGNALLVYNPPPGKHRQEAPSAYRIFDQHGRVTAQGLVESPRHGVYEVFAHKGGFLLLSWADRRAWRVTSTGEATKASFGGRPTEPMPGDILLGDGYKDASLFRPSTNRIHRHAIGPAGASVSHVDGHGVWWAMGKPENGQTVVYSAVPGEPWSKHLIGESSDPHAGCVCDPRVGPLGRGPVIVVNGSELSHVSLDYGRTWRTWELHDMLPFRQARERLRPPQVASLPDGRLLIGYFQYGLATDPTNQSFVEYAQYAELPKRVLWQAGLIDELLYRPGQASPDGGHTWLPDQ
jgi:hypothetical protein